MRLLEAFFITVAVEAFEISLTSIRWSPFPSEPDWKRDARVSSRRKRDN